MAGTGLPRRIARHGNASAGFTLIELLIVLAIIGIVAAAAMVGYRSARVRGNETAALASLHSINRAQFAFSQTCGNLRFSPTLVGLGIPMPTTGQAFLSPDMTGADPLIKSGYQITLKGTEVTDVGQTCNGLTPVASYQMTADPMNPEVSGIRYFGTNTDRVVYEDAAPFTGNMPETGAPGHGAEVK